MSESSMIKVVSAFNRKEIISGVTCRNLHTFSAPGMTFANSAASTPAQVEESFDRLSEFLNVGRNSIHVVRQVHGTEVAIVERGFVATEADAMVTAVPGIIIGVRVADCAPVLLYDPVRNVVAAVHSGWRGSLLNICSRAVGIMKVEFGCNVGQLLAFIGPSAHSCCYEVGLDVAQHFVEHCVPVNGKTDKWMFSNNQAIHQQLTEIGLSKTSIVVSESCTICDLDFHSHRRDSGQAGRGLAYIGLRH
ncbi:MAG: peptidoglycan editing factor PgeF [Ignavibacteria bacterium]|nr:peptidoglycan editing factor PgeF [Ignavibacteria bacterium]